MFHSNLAHLLNICLVGVICSFETTYERTGVGEWTPFATQARCGASMADVVSALLAKAAGTRNGSHDIGLPAPIGGSGSSSGGRGRNNSQEYTMRHSRLAGTATTTAATSFEADTSSASRPPVSSMCLSRLAPRDSADDRGDGGTALSGVSPGAVLPLSPPPSYQTAVAALPSHAKSMCKANEWRGKGEKKRDERREGRTKARQRGAAVVAAWKKKRAAVRFAGKEKDASALDAPPTCSVDTPGDVALSARKKEVSGDECMSSHDGKTLLRDSSSSSSSYTTIDNYKKQGRGGQFPLMAPSSGHESSTSGSDEGSHGGSGNTDGKRNQGWDKDCRGPEECSFWIACGSNDDMVGVRIYPAVLCHR